MKLKYLHLIFIFLLLSLSKMAFAQEVNKSEEIEIYGSSFSEEITLFTDRSIYAIGEDILFKASYSCNLKTNKSFSTVLYVELIESDGSAFVQLKFAIDSNTVLGSIPLPHNLLSGNYYLKAYTKWMRNFPSETYAFQHIKIINPNNPDFNQNVNKQVDVQRYAQIGEIKNLVLKYDKAEYRTGETVNVSLLLDDVVASEKMYCISVVKQGAKDFAESWIATKVNSNDTNYPVHFYPEINGVSISGKVLNSENNQAVNSAVVSTASLGKIASYAAYKTNSSGKFFASVPETQEECDFFINAEKQDLNLKIEIDRDFCTKPVSLFNTEFNLNEEEQGVATEICINAQIKQAFAENDEANDLNSSELSNFSFYGTPEKVFLTKDYVNVPKLQDFIFELIREVKFENNKLVPSFISGKTNTLHSSPYLVLVDNVPISDERAFMNISTEKIERIELINKGYIVGSHVFCGIISVFSKNNDLAGIDLPKNGMFFKYQLLNNRQEKVPEMIRNLNSRYPDRRNCLYWKPNKKLTVGAVNNFSFRTSDVGGKYRVIIQSLSGSDKKPVYFQSSFVVK